MWVNRIVNLCDFFVNIITQLEIWNSKVRKIHRHDPPTLGSPSWTSRTLVTGVNIPAWKILSRLYRHLLVFLARPPVILSRGSRRMVGVRHQWRGLEIRRVLGCWGGVQRGRRVWTIVLIIVWERPCIGFWSRIALSTTAWSVLCTMPNKGIKWWPSSNHIPNPSVHQSQHLCSKKPKTTF